MNQSAASKQQHFKNMKISVIDVIRSILAICTYIFDVGSDVNVAVAHYNAGNNYYFILTVIFIAGPSVIMAIFSFIWYLLDDGEEFKKASPIQWSIRVFFSLLCMAPVLRYFESVYFGWKSLRSDEQKVKQYYARISIYQKTDAAFLRLVETFLESGPQLVLQIYIFSQRQLFHSSSFSEIEVAQLISMPLSLLSISTSISKYVSALRRSLDDKTDLKCPVNLIVIAWRLFDIGSRVIPLGLLASVSPTVFWVACSVHFLVMFLWILSMRTDFCDFKLAEYFYNGTLGLIFTFCFFNPKDEPTRKKYACFYSLMFVENALAMFFWYTESPNIDVKDAIVIFECFAFFMNIVLMVVYYKYLHPTIGIAAERIDVRVSVILKRAKKLAKKPVQVIKDLATKNNSSKSTEPNDDASEALKEADKPPPSPVESHKSSISEIRLQNSSICTKPGEIENITYPTVEELIMNVNNSEISAEDDKIEMSVIFENIEEVTE